MINELIKLADHLDRKGFVKEAEYLDAVLKKNILLVKKIAQSTLPAGRVPDRYPGGQSGAPAIETVIKTVEDENRFRAWANDNHSDYAQQIRLERSASDDPSRLRNRWVQRAWDDLGEEYLSSPLSNEAYDMENT